MYLPSNGYDPSTGLINLVNQGGVVIVPTRDNQFLVIVMVNLFVHPETVTTYVLYETASHIKRDKGVPSETPVGGKMLDKILHPPIVHVAHFLPNGQIVDVNLRNDPMTVASRFQ
tara:strand:- start:8253 stop:8597 length:345 start_codon:yes stop_codon:yes gene_type:complete